MAKAKVRITSCLRMRSAALAGVAAGLFYSQMTLAQWTASIGHTSNFSDNADLTEVQTNDHREDRTWLRLGLDFDQENWLLESNYQATNVNFDSESPTPQPDNDEYNGLTEFTGQFFKRRLALLARHERENFIGEPGNLDLQRNLRARDVFTFAPSWNFISTSSQTVSFGGYYFEVRNDEDASRVASIDSETTGLQLIYDRKISKADTVGLRLSSVSTAYDASFPDNETDTAQLLYSVQLRQLSYSIALGMSRSDFGDNGSTTAPSGNIQLNYDNGATQIGLSSQYLLTDTTRGNQGGGNNDRLNIGNGNAALVERYELFNNNVNANFRVSRRWLVTGRLNYVSESYEDNPLLNQERILAIASIVHEQTRRFNWTLFASHQVAEFDDPDSNQGNELDRYGLTMEYTPLEDLTLQFTWQNRERTADSDLGFNFEEQSYRLGFEYQIRD